MSPTFEVQDPQQKILSLYRKFLAVTRMPKSEEEVVHIVIDSIAELLPAHRVTLSNVGIDGKIVVAYSRSPTGEPVIPAGMVFDASDFPSHVKSLRELQTFHTDDIRKDPRITSLVPALGAFSPALSRMDIPFERNEGSVSVLSVSSSAAGAWSSSVVELVTEAGALAHFVFRDLRNQVKLHQTETIFRQFAENVGVVFWMSDSAKEEMVYVSPAYEKIWGRSVDSLYAAPRSFLEAIHPDDRQRVETALRSQTAGFYEQEYRVVKPTGELRWVKDRAFPVRDERGEVFRIAGIAEDITPLREARERLEASRNQMAANAKFAALGEMASGVAHEINNPLAVIHGLAVQMQELVRRDVKKIPVDMVLDSYCDTERMANRIAGIVKGLRTFSRQTAADPMLPADLNSILTETLAMCAPKLRAASIELELSRPKDRMGIQCRSSEISQVILNLFSNAVDAVAESETRMIRIEVVRQDSGVARLVVEDTGPGIRPELTDRIFQPFFTTKEVGKGTGLGLSISKSIIEAHGGKLFLDQGSPNTRFVVELPSE
jgi:PAS domain S-box-containing protein